MGGRPRTVVISGSGTYSGRRRGAAGKYKSKSTGSQSGGGTTLRQPPPSRSPPRHQRHGPPTTHCSGRAWEGLGRKTHTLPPKLAGASVGESGQGVAHPNPRVGGEVSD